MGRNNQSHNGDSTGPRSPEGKAISKLNATSHGIFSRVVVLKGESHEDYGALLDGLQQACQPVGALEEVLVDKMATTLWRHRRLLLAEVGEIRRNITLPLDSEALSEGRPLSYEEIIGMVAVTGAGLLKASRNAGSLANCREILIRLRDEFEQKGFREETDRKVLVALYGEMKRADFRATRLMRGYEKWVAQSKVPTDRPDDKKRPSAEECKKRMLQLFDEEIDRLRKIIEEKQENELERSELAKLSGSIPDGGGADRILRYEASLERAFDRALAQLERLQRMRLGQPVAPPIKVDLTH